MRIFVILGLLFCLLLSSCELVTPDTSNALSQNRQMEELQEQTKQLHRQANALERLADEVNALTDDQQMDATNPTPTQSP